MKAHGFAKAANAVIDSLSAGTTAGFVVIIFDDGTYVGGSIPLAIGAYMVGYHDV